MGDQRAGRVIRLSFERLETRTYLSAASNAASHKDRPALETDAAKPEADRSGSDASARIQASPEVAVQPAASATLTVHADQSTAKPAKEPTGHSTASQNDNNSPGLQLPGQFELSTTSSVAVNAPPQPGMAETENRSPSSKADEPPRFLPVSKTDDTPHSGHKQDLIEREQFTPTQDTADLTSSTVEKGANRAAGSHSQDDQVSANSLAEHDRAASSEGSDAGQHSQKETVDKHAETDSKQHTELAVAPDSNAARADKAQSEHRESSNVESQGGPAADSAPPPKEHERADHPTASDKHDLKEDQPGNGKIANSDVPSQNGPPHNDNGADAKEQRATHRAEKNDTQTDVQSKSEAVGKGDLNRPEKENKATGGGESGPETKSNGNASKKEDADPAGADAQTPDKDKDRTEKSSDKAARTSERKDAKESTPVVHDNDTSKHDKSSGASDNADKKPLESGSKATANDKEVTGQDSKTAPPEPHAITNNDKQEQSSNRDLPAGDKSDHNKVKEDNKEDADNKQGGVNSEKEDRSNKGTQEEGSNASQNDSADSVSPPGNHNNKSHSAEIGDVDPDGVSEEQDSTPKNAGADADRGNSTNQNGVMVTSPGQGSEPPASNNSPDRKDNSHSPSAHPHSNQPEHALGQSQSDKHTSAPHDTEQSSSQPQATASQPPARELQDNNESASRPAFFVAESSPHVDAPPANQHVVQSSKHQHVQQADPPPSQADLTTPSAGTFTSSTSGITIASPTQSDTAPAVVREVQLQAPFDAFVVGIALQSEQSELHAPSASPVQPIANQPGSASGMYDVEAMNPAVAATMIATAQSIDIALVTDDAPVLPLQESGGVFNVSSKALEVADAASAAGLIAEHPLVEAISEGFDLITRVLPFNLEGIESGLADLLEQLQELDLSIDPQVMRSMCMGTLAAAAALIACDIARRQTKQPELAFAMAVREGRMALSALNF